MLRDHLGNTRLVFTDKNGSGSIDNTEILSETHYYPFGKSFDGAWYIDATASKYKYLYNGKELSEEFSLNFYDYGARWLDPGMGSWWEVDPLADQFPNLSPYNFAENNPVSKIDPDGMASQTIYDFDGKAQTVGDNDYAASSDNGGCPPNCPQTTAKADATGRASSVTPQIATGGVTLPQREQGTLSNADSRLLPHERAGVEGVSLGLEMVGGEIAIVKVGKIIRSLRAASKASEMGFRYMTEGELNAIRETGLLRGGRPGETFYTKDLYKSASKVQQRLALPSTPTHRVEFEILNNPNIIRKGTKVQPAFGMPGKGAEFLTIDPVNVRLINWQPLGH